MRDAQCHTLARTVLEQETRPEADPVGRAPEQPRHRRRDHVPRRGRALATPAPAGPDDCVLAGLDIDLEESGAPLAVDGIELAAARTDARILRRIARFLLLSEPGALGPPVSGGAALLAALAPGARPLLPLALPEISASGDPTLHSDVFTARDAVFGAAALSLNRQTSNCLVSELASDRSSLSDRRRSSRRSSATLARLRSSLTRASASSSKDAQSSGSHTGTTMGSGHRVSSPSGVVRSVPKSASKTAMRETVAHARISYQ